MARRGKPHDPAKATEAALERRERERERDRLIAMGAEVSVDRTGAIISARRSNVFNLLLKRGTITADHFDAAYTLANDWAAWKGLDGRGERGEYVDGGAGCAELVTDRMLRGGRAVSRALGEVDPMSRVILEAFMVVTVEEDRGMSWRGVLERLGIKTLERQTELTVRSVEALRKVYQEPNRAAA